MAYFDKNKFELTSNISLVVFSPPHSNFIKSMKKLVLCNESLCSNKKKLKLFSDQFSDSYWPDSTEVNRRRVWVFVSSWRVLCVAIWTLRTLLPFLKTKKNLLVTLKETINIVNFDYLYICNFGNRIDNNMMEVSSV